MLINGCLRRIGWVKWYGRNTITVLMEGDNWIPTNQSRGEGTRCVGHTLKRPVNNGANKATRNSVSPERPGEENLRLEWYGEYKEKAAVRDSERWGPAWVGWGPVSNRSWRRQKLEPGVNWLRAYGWRELKEMKDVAWCELVEGLWLKGSEGDERWSLAWVGWGPMSKGRKRATENQKH